MLKIRKNHLSIIKNIALSLLILFTKHSISSEIISSKPSTHLSTLLNDMKRYKIINTGYHEGNLYEHSLWTHNGMAELLAHDSLYIKELNLNTRLKTILALGALLHDIGKAGRKDLFECTHPTLTYKVIKNNHDSIESIIYHYDRKEHCKTGFEFLAYPLLAPHQQTPHKQYHLINDDLSLIPFDISNLYQELHITIEEQQIIAIIVGMHYEFGLLRDGKITNQQFLDELDYYVTAVNYNNGVIDEQIVQLSVLINVADIKGFNPVAAHATPFFPHASCPIAPHPKKIPTILAVIWGYECQHLSEDPHNLLAIRALKNLMIYFRESTTHTAVSTNTVHFA